MKQVSDHMIRLTIQKLHILGVSFRNVPLQSGHSPCKHVMIALALEILPA